jgi:3-oxoacyl-[acyl-carrier protein] reductase
MEKRRVLITGGGRGIGQAIAAEFAKHGHEVTAPPRSELDLSSRKAIRAFTAQPGNAAFDVLINNAAENPIAGIGELPLEAFDRALSVDLAAPLQLMQAVTPHMLASGWGRIVNISSCYSLVTRQGRAAYGAAKAGLNSLTRTAALEFAPCVLVNAVCPGFVATELTYRNNSPEQVEALCAQIPLGRLAATEEIGALVYFLGTDANTYITGQSLVIDGGFLCQ